MLEDLRVDEQQRPVDAQLLPVVALAERVEEAAGLARPEREPDGVAGLDPGRGLGWGQRLGHGAPYPGASERDGAQPEGGASEPSDSVLVRCSLSSGESESAASGSGVVGERGVLGRLQRQVLVGPGLTSRPRG